MTHSHLSIFFQTLTLSSQPGTFLVRMSATSRSSFVVSKIALDGKVYHTVSSLSPSPSLSLLISLSFLSNYSLSLSLSLALDIFFHFLLNCFIFFLGDSTLFFFDEWFSCQKESSLFSREWLSSGSFTSSYARDANGAGGGIDHVSLLSIIIWFVNTFLFS